MKLLGIKLSALLLLTIGLLFAAACDKPAPPNQPAQPSESTQPVQPTQPNNNTTTPANETHGNVTEKTDAPVTVKAAFPEAQSFTLEHRALSGEMIAAIEKEAQTKVPARERDFHAYLARKTEPGKPTQILGAAAILNVDGVASPIEVMVAVDSDINIKKVAFVKGDTKGEIASEEFLKQFVGKGHHDKIKVGEDINFTGKDKTSAAAVAETVRRAEQTLTQLYGKAHSH
ncbi:MAG: hypothetical protein AB1489_08615 [Acidobacteriota bacterium]